MSPAAARDLALGIDLGTASVKALLLDAGGRVRGRASRAYAVAAPRPGWAETDPEAWWRATQAAVRACLAAAGAARDAGPRVAAVGLSGQMHGAVLTRRDGTAVRPAVLWADTRSREALAAYRALPAETLRRLANPITAGMAGPTLVWLLRHEAGACRETRWALQPKDWLRLRLTGEAAAEPSDASATLLYDLPADRWAEEVIAALGLPLHWFAPLRASHASTPLAGAAAAALGLPAGLPVAAGGGDTACAAYGTALREAGEVQVTVGSGMQVVAVRSSPDIDATGRTHLFRTVEEGWYGMAAMQNGGLALEWVRSMLALGWDGMYAEAFATPAGAEGVSFLPYLSGERTPLMDPDARGSFLGLTLRHGREHLARAAFEGVAFALRDGLAALEETGVRAGRLRLAGGGSLRAPWRQLLADVLGRPLDAVAVPDASARGAAQLGWLAVGHTSPLPPDPTPAAEPVPAEALERAYGLFRVRRGDESS